MLKSIVLFVMLSSINFLVGCAPKPYQFLDVSPSLTGNVSIHAKQINVMDKRSIKSTSNKIPGIGGDLTVNAKDEHIAGGFFGIYKSYVDNKLAQLVSINASEPYSINFNLEYFNRYSRIPGIKMAPFAGLLFMGMKDAHGVTLIASVEVLDAHDAPLFYKKYEMTEEEEKLLKSGDEAKTFTDQQISNVLYKFGLEVARDMSLYKNTMELQQEKDAKIVESQLNAKE